MLKKNHTENFLELTSTKKVLEIEEGILTKS